MSVQLMTDPPKIGREDKETVDLYNEEKGHVERGLKKRAALLESTLNDMDQVTCTKVAGAMYAFPKIHFSNKFLQQARD